MICPEDSAEGNIQVCVRISGCIYYICLCVSTYIRKIYPSALTGDDGWC